MERSTDFSHGHTYHQAMSPNTSKEKEVWIPNMANGSTRASVPKNSG